MSRSKQRSKCTRVGCLLCKPHKASGEQPISALRSTVDAPQTIAFEAAEPEPWDYDDDACPYCDHAIFIGSLAWHISQCGHARVVPVPSPNAHHEPITHRIPLSRVT